MSRASSMQDADRVSPSSGGLLIGRRSGGGGEHFAHHHQQGMHVGSPVHMGGGGRAKPTMLETVQDTGEA